MQAFHLLDIMALEQAKRTLRRQERIKNIVAKVHPGDISTAPFAGMSPNVWQNFPIYDIINDPGGSLGHFDYENFYNFPVVLTNTAGFAKGWNTFTDNGAAIADGAIANLASAAFSSDGDNECASMARCMAGIRITKNSGRRVSFETRVKFSTIADTKNGAFFGLFEPIVPTSTSHIADAGTLVDKNFVGFHRLEGDGSHLDIVYKATGQTQQSFTDAKTIVADTFYKLGFTFDGITTMKFYFNGFEYTTARLGSAGLVAATFPSTANLAPAIIGAKNATGTTPGTNYVNWVAFGFTNAPADGFA